jgi:hypothetical protein
LNDRRAKRLLEGVRVARTQPWPATACDAHHGAVTAGTARGAQGTGASGVRRYLRQPNRGIAAHLAETARDPGLAGKRGVEQRHAVDATTACDNGCVDEIHAGDGERFAGRRQTGLLDFTAQPVRRRAIDVGRRPMEALLFERLDDRANAGFARRLRAQRRDRGAGHQRHRQPVASGQRGHQ